MASVFRVTTRSLVCPRQSCLASSSRIDLPVFYQTTRNASKAPTKSSSKGVKGRPRNQQIEHRVVRMVNPETSHLEPAEELSEILRRTDLTLFAVELVTEHPEPIVKLVNMRDEYLKRKAQEEKKRVQPRPREEKEIMMTWGVSLGDFDHKLDKARQELEKGNRVTLIYARRKDQPQLTPEEMEARVQETISSLAEAGAEWRPRKANKHTTSLYFQGHNLPPPLPQRPQQETEKPAVSSYAQKRAKRS
ncbi:hypothetical protein BKA93DRAFT_912695 [Sparassis latifolia]|uniref:Translation initiation factor IF-3 n=1 Tax=Sparassis crispa TaxID=139825 RepID=A0A401GAD3_9APHY|nr:hypothetical protein SCP_0203040 [Sparassis crispa]GBE79107.1 hypothetical protein SCP_0203040 [Sparassis crispa]